MAFMLAQKLISIALVAGLSGTAFAQAPENPFSNSGGGTTPPAPAADTDTSARTTDAPRPRPDAKPDLLLRMSKKDCETVLRRRNVVGADYVPGVDVRGNSVAGADLKGTLTAADILPEEIAFELSLNPLSFAGNEALEDSFSNTSTSFGMVRYNLSSGSLTLDGKRLNDETEEDLVEICRQALGRN